MRKIGINYGAKAGLSVEEYAATVKALGFDAVFTGTPTREKSVALGEAFAKNGLAWETIHAPYKGINAIWFDDEAGVAMLRQLTDAVDACVMSGVPLLVVHLSSGLTPPPVTDAGRAHFAALVEYAGAKNIRIAFENQRMLGNIAWAFEAFANAPHVGFCWDTGHENCFTPGRQYMPLFGSKLVCTHIHDNSGEFDHDEHLLPFDGKLDFSRAARQIRESGFEGTLMLEAIAANSHRYDDIGVEEYLARAAQAAKRLRCMVDEI